MIILDETNDVAKSGVPPEPLSPSEQSPPPPPYSSQPTDPLLPRSAYSARKRFLNAFLLACLAALLAAGLLGSAIVSWRIRRGAVPPTIPTAPPRTPELSRCIPWRDWSLRSRPEEPGILRVANFTIPLDSKRLSFESFGDLAAGTVSISADPNNNDSDVYLEVAAEHHSREALELASVCHWAQPDGHYTIQIFAPTSAELREPIRPLSLTVIIVLPNNAAIPSVPYHYPDIHTNMPRFMHTVRSLEGRIRLGHLSLNTTGRAVNVDKLIASRVDIATTNAIIRGAFDVSSSLTLSAPGGRIHIFADMTNSNTSTTPVNMTLSASNGSISSTIRLHSSSWHGEGGLFNVTARSINGPVMLDVSAAPVESRLVLNAKAIGARADVILHPTFEGLYLIESAHAGSTKLHERKEVEDPSGRGRTRRVEKFNWRNQRMAGYIGWSSAPVELLSPWGGVVIESDEAVSLTV